MRARNAPVPPCEHAPDLPEVLEPVDRLAPHDDVLGALLTIASGPVDAAHARLTEVRWEAASVDDVELGGAVLSDVAITDLRAVSLMARESTWRNVVIDQGRIASLDALRAQWSGVTLRGLRIDYLALPSAEVSDLLIEDCSIGTLDLPEAQLTRVRFAGTSVDEVDTRGLRSRDVDLRGLEALSFTDVRGLAGATLDARQAELHAAAFADALQIRIAG